MINSRDIKDLHPFIAEKCKAHIEACQKKGVTIIVTLTLRDDEYQASLYAKGRTEKGNIVTNLNVTGAHGLGLAYDVVPVVKGKAIWNDNRLWAIIGEKGKKLGLNWGGSWKSFVDKPHFELTDGLSAKQLRDGLRPKWYSGVDDFDDIKSLVSKAAKALELNNQEYWVDVIKGIKQANPEYIKQHFINVCKL